ncbi:cytochrome c oxidase subunit 4 [Virgibacillus subterraneus]|uniref:Cytochrome c oxidase subunit 4 n=2 Tax=Virgibacillus TaxID=84406 RepID=A0A1H1CJ66_9BACI|nr:MULTISPECIES: cytochrome c oxidase subunit IVB [Virgibacillus]SDQ63726.1 cytochrome c oxidase subunit 4 [Virgibacillus salinus]SEQ62091.1 cytochrome c oxidase subunit 4 [Virgibacillus subterraneus]
MAENTNSNEVNPYQKHKNKLEMQKQLITFALMILFTIIAFVIVATGMMQKMFVIPVLLILAVIQVAFQFYYFMHMKEKGHDMPSLMMYAGIMAALLIIAGLVVITWW